MFADITAFSRVRVQSVFRSAAVDATDAPGGALAEALGRLLYVVHLGVILCSLLDRSPRQRATHSLVALLRQILPSASLALRLRPVSSFVRSADALLEEALVGGAGR